MKVPKTDHYVFDGLDPIQIKNTQNGQFENLYRANTFGQNRIIAAQNFPSGSKGQMYWMSHDAIGSIVGITKDGGVSDHNYRYSDFGEVEPDQGNWTAPHNNFTYTGQELDPNYGIYEFFSRAYDPTTGVWNRQDEYRGQYNDPQSLHRYGYVMNDPIGNWDAYGFYECGKYDGPYSQSWYNFMDSQYCQNDSFAVDSTEVYDIEPEYSSTEFITNGYYGEITYQDKSVPIYVPQVKKEYQQITSQSGKTVNYYYTQEGYEEDGWQTYKTAIGFDNGDGSEVITGLYGALFSDISTEAYINPQKSISYSNYESTYGSKYGKIKNYNSQDLSVPSSGAFGIGFEIASKIGQGYEFAKSDDKYFYMMFQKGGSYDVYSELNSCSIQSVKGERVILVYNPGGNESYGVPNSNVLIPRFNDIVVYDDKVYPKSTFEHDLFAEKTGLDSFVHKADEKFYSSLNNRLK